MEQSRSERLASYIVANESQNSFEVYLPEQGEELDGIIRSFRNIGCRIDRSDRAGCFRVIRPVQSC